MLTNDAIAKLKDLIQQSAGDVDVELLEALDDVARVIGTQAAMIASMKRRLDVLGVSMTVLRRSLTQRSIEGVFANMGTPRRNTFSAEAALEANRALLSQVRSATDFADVFKAVVEVAKVLI